VAALYRWENWLQAYRVTTADLETPAEIRIRKKPAKSKPIRPD